MGRIAPRAAVFAAGALALGLGLASASPDSTPAREGLDPDTFDRASAALLERARQIADGAGPDYQGRVLEALRRSKRGRSAIHLSDRLGEARASRSTSPASALDPVLFGYEFEDPDAAEVNLINAYQGAAVEGGRLVIAEPGEALLANPFPVAIPRQDIGEIELRVRAGESGRLSVHWSSEEFPEKPTHHGVRIDLRRDGRFHRYAINADHAMRRGLVYGDLLKRLILRVETGAGERVEIDYVRLVSRAERYREKPFGVGMESVRGEMRHAIYAVPPLELAWDVDVPLAAPRLDLGVGVLRDDLPVVFRVRVDHGGGGEPLFEKTLELADGWRDTSLDLARFAGKRVTLRLSAKGSPNNVALWAHPTLHGTPAERTNVIVYLEDTFRADYLSALGYPKPTSPVRDAFARQGALFSTAIAQATETLPSIPSFMTSLPPSATGVWHNGDRLLEPYLTLAEILRASGFSTASFIQNGNAGPHAGMHQGFETILDYELVGTKTEAVLGDELRSWLERQRDRNFFLYVHVIDPHGPYEPTAPHDAWARSAPPSPSVSHDRRMDPSSLEAPSLEERRLRYAGEIRHNDDVFEKFLAQLEALGLRERTLVVLLSDHGEYLGERDIWGHRPPGTMPVVNVPLILVQPGRVPAAQRIDDPVQLMDVLPTVLDLLDIDRSGMLLAGDSLAPLLAPEGEASWPLRAVLSEEPASREASERGEPCDCGSLFVGPWHLLRSRAMPGESVVAFHLPDDRAERRPRPPGEALAQRAREVLSAAQRSHGEAWRRFSHGEDHDIRLDPDVQDHLRALGYLD